MFTTESEAYEYLEDQEVKFVLLAFCDVFGSMKNVSIMLRDLHRAFQSGLSIDASAIRGFGSVDESDLFLKPVLSTLTLLPWRPAQGRIARFYCNIFYPDGSPFEMDSRDILKRSVERAAQMGIRVSFGAECEFYLFRLDENGDPTQIPADTAHYMDVAPFDKGEIVRREICLALEQMNFTPETSHHEEGPGQNEIDFRYSGAMSSADNVLTFKSVVETVAAANGFHASFAPKPMRNQAGNGFHINMSPRRLEDNEPDPGLKRWFMAGILSHIREMTAFLNSTEESYQRLGTFKAPRYITWSNQNRSQLIRIPAGTGEYDRIELRSPDCMTNPYVAYALLLEAGMDGIRRQLEPSDSVNRNLYELSGQEETVYETLPSSLPEALNLAEASVFIKSILPDAMTAAIRSRYREEAVHDE